LTFLIIWSLVFYLCFQLKKKFELIYWVGHITFSNIYTYFDLNRLVISNRAKFRPPSVFICIYIYTLHDEGITSGRISFRNVTLISIFLYTRVLNDLISKGKRKKRVCRDQWQWYVLCMQYTWEVHGRFLTGVKTNTVFLYGNQPDWHDRCAVNGARNKHVNEAKFFFLRKGHGLEGSTD